MRLGENYLANNPDPRLAKWQARNLWRKLLSVFTAFTEGDDLSHYNTVANWAEKQTENKFSVLKIGEGNSPNPDPELFYSVAQALASNTAIMGYWFFRSNVSGALQGDYAVAILEQVAQIVGYKPVIWIDVETSDNTGNAMRLTRLKEMVDKLNLWNPGKVGLYSSPGFANIYLTPVPAWLNTLWHWIAHWTDAPLPTQPNGWNTARRKIWQYGIWPTYAWAKPVPGAQPPVDTDRFFGTEEEMRAFTGAPPALTLEQRVAALEAAARLHGWEV